jgi:protein subunit release factor B
MEPITSLNESDLEEIFERSSGPGGQNVNKVATRVMLRHKPSGISVTVQDSRSQAQNRRLARERLIDELNRRRAEAEAGARREREKIRRQKRARPPRVKRRILEAKRQRAQIKKLRSRSFD